MIHFERKDNKLICYVEKGPLNYRFLFEFDCDNTFYADLLEKHFDNVLRSTIESIRIDEYEEGYKAGKQKQAKKTWFKSTLK